MVLADEMDGARLGALVALALGRDVAHLAADLELIECPVGYAVAVEIDLVAVRRFDESVPLVREQLGNAAVRRRFVGFDFATVAADIILEVAFAAGGNLGNYAFYLGVGAALLTAFYSWRLIFLTFHGKPRADAEVMSQAHESPKMMTVPLIALAVGAIFAGIVAAGWMIGDGAEAFWGEAIFVLPENDNLEAAHHLSFSTKSIPTIVAFVGVLIAWYLYMRNKALPARLAGASGPLYRFLLNKWYFDELYDRIFVRPAIRLGTALWKRGDGRIIDGFGPDGFAAAVINLARRAGSAQTGYLYHYAFVMLASVAGLVTWLLLTGSG